MRIVDLLLDAATDDRVLPGQVAQIIEQFRGHLDHIASATFRRGHRQLRRCRVRVRLAGGGVGQCCAAEIADVVDQRRGRVQRLLQAHGVEHVGQAVMAVLQQAEQRRAGLQLAGGEQLVEKFQFVGQVADRGDLDHSRTTLEGVQVTQQVFHLDAIARLGLPAQQGRTGAFDQVEAFFEEDLQQLFVASVLLRFDWLVHWRWRRCVMTKLAQRRQQLDLGGGHLALLQLFEHLRQLLMAALEQGKQLGTGAEASVHQALVKQFKLLRQHFERTHGSHLRAALEGLQVTGQRRQCRGVVGIQQPARQGLVGAVENVAGFIEEQLDHG
ncbi:hypothetical protein D3C81_1176170 [compost metagenome]